MFLDAEAELAERGGVLLQNERGDAGEDGQHDLFRKQVIVCRIAANDDEGGTGPVRQISWRDGFALDAKRLEQWRSRSFGVVEEDGGGQGN